MKSFEFEATMSPGGEIVLPAEFAREIPAGEQLKVILMWESSSLDSEWRSAGRRKFEEAYCAEDAVYDRLLDETPGR